MLVKIQKEDILHSILIFFFCKQSVFLSDLLGNQQNEVSEANDGKNGSIKTKLLLLSKYIIRKIPLCSLNMLNDKAS